MIRLATSIANVEPSAVRAIGNAALGMEDVYKLQFGESDQPTPDFIKAALAQAVADGYLYYSENEGLPSLRRSVPRHGVSLRDFLGIKFVEHPLAPHAVQF